MKDHVSLRTSILICVAFVVGVIFRDICVNLKTFESGFNFKDVSFDSEGKRILKKLKLEIKNRTSYGVESDERQRKPVNRLSDDFPAHSGRLSHLSQCDLVQSPHTLSTLASKYRPSKFGYVSGKSLSYKHTGYQRFYPLWMEEYRQKKFKMLEIGIDSGQGSLLWKEYFPCAELWGLEYGLSATKTTGAQSINVIRGDQGDVDFLKGQFMDKTGGHFDLIVDDGGHHYEQQSTSYLFLFEKALNARGLYVIEDIETSYWKKGSDLYGKKLTKGGQSEPRTIINMFKNVVDVVNNKFFDHNYKVFGIADQWIQQLTFASNVIFILKKGKEDCVYETDYIWPHRLAEDCPAKSQRGIDSALKSFCST